MDDTPPLLDCEFWTYNETINWIGYRHADMARWLLSGLRQRARGQMVPHLGLCPYPELIERVPEKNGLIRFEPKTVDAEPGSSLRKALQAGKLRAYDQNGNERSAALWANAQPDEKDVFRRDEVRKLWPEVGKPPKRERGRPKGERIDDSETVRLALEYMLGGESNKTAAIRRALQTTGVCGQSENADIRRVSRKLGTLGH